MSLRTIALDWSVDGPLGTALLLLVLGAGCLYVAAARHGSRHDRRGRRWPRRRTVSFLGGLVALIVDMYSGIGTEADTSLSAHMLEHMVIWVGVAPLLAAGGPVRLAFYALPRGGRRKLARSLHSRVVSTMTGPIGSVLLFSAVVVISQLPAAYRLTLSNGYAHEAEHGLYLVTALIMWAPVLGVDPLPNRAGPKARAAGMAACMVPMALIGGWLGTANTPVYGQYGGPLGPSALHDQRLAAAIMWGAALPAFAVPALRPLRLPRWRAARRIACGRLGAWELAPTASTGLEPSAGDKHRE